MQYGRFVTQLLGGQVGIDIILQDHEHRLSREVILQAELQVRRCAARKFDRHADLARKAEHGVLQGYDQVSAVRMEMAIQREHLRGDLGQV